MGRCHNSYPTAHLDGSDRYRSCWAQGGCLSSLLVQQRRDIQQNLLCANNIAPIP